MNFMAKIAFDGKPYIGFQKQTKFHREPIIPFKTIQGSLEQAVSDYFEQQITIKGASRTDGGVSAYNFPVQFKVQNPHQYENLHYNKFDLSLIQKAVNNKLKWADEQIYLQDVIRVPDEFELRQHIKSKTYTYNILHGLGKMQTSHIFDKSYNLEQRLHLDILMELAAQLKGKRSFYYFTSETSDLNDFKRTVLDIQFQTGPHPHLEDVLQTRIDFTGIGFLRYQIRYMIGSLIRIHHSQKLVSEFQEILNDDSNDKNKRNNLSWRIKAPAEGLTFSNFQI